MLLRPLDMQMTALVKVHLAFCRAWFGTVVCAVLIRLVARPVLAIVTNLVPTVAIVLGIEQPSCVVNIIRLFEDFVVRSSWVMQINISPTSLYI